MTYRDHIQAEAIASARRVGGLKGAKYRRHYRLCVYWMRAVDRRTAQRWQRERVGRRVSEV